MNQAVDHQKVFGRRSESVEVRFISDVCFPPRQLVVELSHLERGAAGRPAVVTVSLSHIASRQQDEELHQSLHLWLLRLERRKLLLEEPAIVTHELLLRGKHVIGL